MTRTLAQTNLHPIRKPRGTGDDRVGTLRLPAVPAHDLWAATYDQAVNPLLFLEEKTLGPLLPNVGGACVLDLACGTGRWLEKLARRGARGAVGIDLSREMLVRAQRKQLIEHRLIRADCSAIPIQSGVIDLAICSFAVTYMSDLDCFAREVARVIKPGGMFFISDFHPSGFARGWKRTFRWNERVVEISSSEYSIEEIRRTLLTTGFEQVLEVQPRFGEEERNIFRRRGKEDLFGQACEGPAIYVSGFVQTGGGR